MLKILIAMLCCMSCPKIWNERSSKIDGDGIAGHNDEGLAIMQAIPSFFPVNNMLKYDFEERKIEAQARLKALLRCTIRYPLNKIMLVRIQLRTKKRSVSRSLSYFTWLPCNIFFTSYSAKIFLGVNYQPNLIMVLNSGRNVPNVIPL